MNIKGNIKQPWLVLPMATPFTDRDEVDHAAIRSNIGMWLDAPISSFVVGTASGEEWYLSGEEILSIADNVVNEVKGECLVFGGIDSPSVSNTLKRAEEFAKVGCNGVRIRIPRYPDQVLPYFKEVLALSPLPVLIMHQSNPEIFGSVGSVAASPSTIGEIVRMGNVIGYNSDHDARFEAHVRRNVPEDMRFLFPNGSLTLIGTLVGANGVSTAIANVLPYPLYEILNLGMAGKFTEANAIQERISRVDELMLPYGPAGIKAAMNLIGMKGTKPRSPRQAVSENVSKSLHSILESNGFL